ncbi:MAG: Dabb family protein [Algibacter sp.]|uniref:Dabb family protein n=1 Tax=Algibacter sp. TaxID=1872428 RepID=UPI002615BF77|nr:Dabb family protein [Algibacter sp.]MDG1731263.1 Dabb family protein [Algibacter sp.]MDG2178796.1 Dabb family protein [Algibacter sp.]
MYKHIVFWKLKEQANGMSKQELATEVKRRLDELPAHIPEIVSYETGINIGDYGASFFDVSVIGVYKNKDTFWDYTKYPIHDAVVAYIQSVQEDEQIVDYDL